MKEEWRDVVGFEGKYEISNLGRVKSLPKLNGHRLSKEKILKPKINKYGYECVNLCYGDGKRKHITIHRLVATAFLNNDNKLETVNHIDGNKLNNNVNNLEWCSVKDNVIHAWNKGLFESKRKKASEFHGHGCILIDMNTREKIFFNSKQQLSLFLGYKRSWLSSAIKNKTNYTDKCRKKGYLIELEVSK